MKNVFLSQKQLFATNYTRSITYRETMLNKLLHVIKANEQEIMLALSNDLGKSNKESYLTELFMVYKSIKHAKKNLSKWSRDQKVKTPLMLLPGKSYTRSIPYGVSLVMNAYNYPLLLSIDPLIGSIAAGNTTMLALSKRSKHTNAILIKIINETFDSNYLYAFETDRNINNKLFSYNFDKFFFTGSENVGKKVYAAAASQMASVSLELGGKSPSVVLRDANIKQTAKQVIYSKGINSGQTCIATDYVLVDEMIADEFIKQLIIEDNKMYPSLNDFGNIIDTKSYNRLLDIVNNDIDYVVNEYDLNEDNNQMSIVLLKSDIQEAKHLVSMQSEIFGPILPIITYKTLDEAIKFMHKHPNPLALYVFGNRKNNINTIIENVDSGGVSINNCILHMVNENLPFGGIKSSGVGSYHGKYSFDAFSHTQAVYKKFGFKFQNIILPPYKK